MLACRSGRFLGRDTTGDERREQILHQRSDQLGDRRDQHFPGNEATPATGASWFGLIFAIEEIMPIPPGRPHVPARARTECHAAGKADGCRRAERQPGMASDQRAHIGGLVPGLVEALTEIAERRADCGLCFGRLSSQELGFGFSGSGLGSRRLGRTGAAGARVFVHSCE